MGRKEARARYRWMTCVFLDFLADNERFGDSTYLSALLQEHIEDCRVAQLLSTEDDLICAYCFQLKYFAHLQNNGHVFTEEEERQLERCRTELKAIEDRSSGH
jgi:hypothetical protein